MAKKTAKRWVITLPKPPSVKPSEDFKIEVQRFFEPLVEKFKEQYILENPNKDHVYTVDIFTEWNRSGFYFCQKSKAEFPNRIGDEFIDKFVRLMYKGGNEFDFAYFRHTGKWWVVAENVTKEKSLEMILENPNFHPL